MIVRVDKSFEKDLKKLCDSRLNKIVYNLILELQNLESPIEIKNLKKLQGTKSYYRIRVGDYRIGIEINANTIDMIRILHRKEIYRFFP